MRIDNKKLLLGIVLGTSLFVFFGTNFASDASDRRAGEQDPYPSPPVVTGVAYEADSWVYLPIIYNPNAHWRAQGYKVGNFYGVWAYMTTADPAIRELLFSYASVSVLDPNGKWVETGWLKSPNTGCVPKFTWAIQPGDAHFIGSPTPIIGHTYEYMIFRVSNGNWRLQIVDTPVVIVDLNISNPGMNYSDKVMVFGEVHSKYRANDMGPSNLTSLRWEGTDLRWRSWNGWIPGVVDSPYNIEGIAPDPNNNVKVNGNNGTPIPPGAPCP